MAGAGSRDTGVSQLFCSKHGAYYAASAEALFRCAGCLMEENYEQCSECGYWNPRIPDDPWPCRWARCTRNRYMSKSFGPMVSLSSCEDVFNILRVSVGAEW